MKLNPLSLGAVFAAAICIASCSKQEAPDLSHTIEFTSLTGQRVFTLDDTAQEFGCDADLAFRDSASVLLPEVLYGFDVAPLRDRILELAFDTVCAPEQAMAHYFVEAAESFGYSATPADSTAHEEYLEGYCQIDGLIYSLSPRYLTYRVSEYAYYPRAAHGRQRLSFITYDLRRGDIMTLDEIFTPQGLEALPSLISRRAKKLEQQLGPTNITSLPAEGDFYISLEDEVVFVYQPYEVASYAQGTIYVPFYPYDLSDYMTPRGLSFFGLGEGTE